MKHILLNLKRFDVPSELGGVNRLAPVTDWAGEIVRKTQDELGGYDPKEAEFIDFMPEAHIQNAVGALCEGSVLQIGSQGVFRSDVTPGGNFGAFTTNLPAAAVKALGAEAVLIGHCEERNDKKEILSAGGVIGDEQKLVVIMLLDPIIT